MIVYLPSSNGVNLPSAPITVSSTLIVISPSVMLVVNLIVISSPTYTVPISDMIKVALVLKASNISVLSTL